jgi:OCT family organic cation transporter-like MFS transporter 15
MYFSHSLNLTTAMMFIFGMAAVGRTSISFLYLMELLPTNRQVLVGTILHVNNAAVGVFGCLYFWKISKNWLWLAIVFAEAAGVIVFGLTLMLPESPRYLVSLKRYDEARASINFFVSKDSKIKFVGRFDKEVSDLSSSY